MCLIDDSGPVIFNSIFWNNEPQEFYFEGGCTPCLTISYSDVDAGQGGIVGDNGEVTWGEGNIDTDPLFVDADNGDFHLTENSPCIDTGDPESDDDPDGTRADMGAYYFDHRQASIYVDPAGEAAIQTSLGSGRTEDHYISVSNEGDGVLSFNTEIEIISEPERDQMGRSLRGASGADGPSRDARGAVDDMDYEWRDNNEEDGPVYEWVDISAYEGVQVFNVDDDENSGSLNLGFTFPFWDTEYSRIYIDSDGYTSFTYAGVDYYLNADSYPVRANTYQVNHSTIVVRQADYGYGTIRYWTNNVDEAIISWYSNDSENYQLFLKDNGLGTLQMGPGCEQGNAGVNHGDGAHGWYFGSYGEGSAISFGPSHAFNSWLSVSPADGELEPEGQTDLTLTLNANNLVVGDYIADLHITSNDPENGDVIVGVEMEVFGLPGIEVSWGSEFGCPDYADWNEGFQDVFNNIQYDVEFGIHNPGSATLEIDSLRFSEGYFSTIADEMSIIPDESHFFSVSLESEESSDFEDILIIYSNHDVNPVIEIPLFATTSNPPVLGIDPESFEKYLDSGGQSEDVVTISNSGESALNFTITHEILSEPSRDDNERSLRSISGNQSAPLRDNAGDVLYTVNSPFGGGLYKNFAYDPEDNWMWINAYGGAGSVKAIDIDNDYSIVREWDAQLGMGMDMAFYDGILYIMQLSQEWVSRFDIDGNNIGNLNIQIDGQTNGVAIDFLNERLLVGTGDRDRIQIFDLSGNILGTISNVNQYVQNEEWHSIDWVPSHPDGKLWIGTAGKLWQIKVDGPEWVIEGDEAVQMIYTHSINVWDGFAHDGQDMWVSCQSNATLNVYDDGNEEEFPWITYGPTHSTVASDDYKEVYLYTNFIDRVEGDYEADIIFNTNDPANEEVRVRLLCHITGFPQIDVSWDSDFSSEPVDWNEGFEYVYVDYQYDALFKIQNVGTGTLTVDSLRFTENIFSTQADQMTIIPYNTESFYVSITPNDADYFEDTLVVYSDAIDNPEVRFALIAEAFYPPHFDINPTYIEDNLESGQTQDYSLYLTNDGDSELRFTVDHEIISDPNRDKVERTLRSTGQNGAPVRDAAGDVLYSVNSPFGASQYKNLSFDPDDNWMWIQQFSSPYPVYALDLENDFSTVRNWNNPSGGGMDMAYCDGIIYSVNLNGPYVCRIDIDGNNLGNLNLNLDGYAYGVATDIVDGLLIVGTEYLERLFVFDLVGNEIGIIENVNQVMQGQRWRAVEWVPYHLDGQLWLGSGGIVFQMKIDTEEWVIEGGQAVQSFYTSSGNDWDGLAHDGHDFWFPNYYTTTINVYDDGNDEVYPWLAYEPKSGNIMEYYGDAEIYIDLNFENYLAGDYEANLIINTNDPEAQQVYVNILIHLSGTPEMNVAWSEDYDYPEEIDFNMPNEDVFTNRNYDLIINIQSVGTAALEISDITANNGAFSVDMSEFTVNPRHEQEIILTFNASEPGVYEEMLSIQGNFEDYNIPLYASALNPPVVIVDPEDISQQIQIGTTNDENTIAVVNNAENGSAALRYSIILEETRAGGRDVSRRILRSTSGDANGPQRDEAGYQIGSQQVPFSNTRGLAWDGAYMWAVDYYEYMLYSMDIESGTYREELQNYTDYPFHGLAFDGEYLWAAYQESYGERNVILYQFDTDGHQISTQQLTASSMYYFRGMTCDQDNHLFFHYLITGDGDYNMILIYNMDDLSDPIGYMDLPMEGGQVMSPGRDTQFGGNIWGNITWVPSHQNGQLWVLAETAGVFSLHQFEVYTGEWGIGEEIQSFEVQTDSYLSGIAHDGEYMWIGNTGSSFWTCWDDGVNDGLGWLKIDPNEGEVNPQAEAVSSVLFDANGIDGGIYRAYAHVLTNDPNTPDVVVEVTLDVIGVASVSVQWPENAGYPEVIDWNGASDNVFTGYPATIEVVEVHNHGTDVLNIDDIYLDNEEFTVEPQAFTVAINQSQILTLTLNGGEDGDHSATMTIYSDDPENEELAISLYGYTSPPPVINVSEEYISLSLNIGDTDEAGVDVSNQGGSVLDYRIEAEEVLNPTRDKMSRELRQVGGHKGSGGPRRDASGDQVRTLRIPYNYCSGLAWDGNLMWGIYSPGEYGYGYLYAMNLETGDAEQELEINGSPYFLAYDGELLWTVVIDPEYGQCYLDAYDSNQNRVHHIYLFEGLEVQGLAADRDGHLLFMSNQEPLIIVFNTDDVIEGGEYGPVAMIDLMGGGGASVPGRDEENFFGNLTWVPEHYDGHLWVNTHMEQEIYGAVQFNINEQWEAEMIQWFEWDAENHMVGLAHDGENIWHGGYEESMLYSYDDGAWEGLGWLTLSSSGGEIDVEGSETIYVYFDATGIYGGLYEADLHFISNDPANPDVALNVQLEVSGAPEIDVIWNEDAGYPDLVDWNGVNADVFTGYDSDVIISILSIGTDDVVVDSIRVDNDDFSVNPESVEAIRPEHNAPITITLNAGDDGAHEGTLHIYSNDEGNAHIQLSLTAESEQPPAISVYPDHFRTYLSANETEDLSLTVANNGATSLQFKAKQEIISREDQGGGQSVPVRDQNFRSLRGGGSTSGSGPQRDEFGETIDGFGVDYETTGMCYDGELMWGVGYEQAVLFAIDLVNQEVVHEFNIHAYPWCLAFDGQQFWVSSASDGPSNNVFLYDMQGNQTDQFSLDLNRDYMGIIGMASDHENYMYVNGFTMNEYPVCMVFDIESHAKVAEFQYEWPEAPPLLYWNMEYVPAHENGQLWVQAGEGYGGGDIVCAPGRDGDGVVIGQFHIDGEWNATFVNGFGNNDSDPGMGLGHDEKDLWLAAVGEGFAWMQVDDGIMEYWLTFSPRSGDVEPDGSLEVDVYIDPAGFTEGYYESDLVFSSNDPEMPEVRVNFQIRIGENAGILIVPEDEIIFDDTYIGDARQSSVLISNVGNAALSIDPIEVVNGGEGSAFSSNLDENYFDLQPEESRRVIVSFRPDEGGEFSGNLVINSNDQDNDEVSVYLGGYGLTPPPDIYLAYLEEDDPGIVFEEHTIDSGFDGAMGLSSIDLDSDNDLDIIACAAYANQIAWWANDGNQSFSKNIISENFTGASQIFAVDLDNDEDIDVIGTSRDSDKLHWWENDGEENFEEHIIDDNYNGAHFISAIDLDYDGDVDIVISTAADEGGDGVDWWENDGEQNFQRHQVAEVASNNYEINANDFDDDGDIDIICVSHYGDAVFWFENDGDQNFNQHTISGISRPTGLFIIDMDNDRDKDAIGCGQSLVRWWENNGNEDFTGHTISSAFSDTRDVFGLDIDGDGFVDVLVTDQGGDEISWWKNDGSQNFAKHTISDAIDGPHTVIGLDLDSDNDMDVITSAIVDDEVVWFENTREVTWDFGTVEKDSSAYWTFRIYNHGSETLTISAIDYESEHYTTDFEGEVNINSGEHYEATITFTPLEFNDRMDGVFTIYSNDPDEDEIVVRAVGDGVFVNYEPEVVIAIPDYTLDEDFEPFIVADLDTIFSDPNPEDVLTYEVYDEVDEFTVEIINDSELQIDSDQDWFGEVEIEVLADDGNGGGELEESSRRDENIRQLRRIKVSKVENSAMAFNGSTNADEKTSADGNETVVSLQQGGTLRALNPERDASAYLSFHVTVNPLPVISVDPAYVDFGDVLVGGIGSKAVTIANVGQAALHISDIHVEGEGFTDNLDGETELEIAVDATRLVIVNLVPDNTGAHNGELIIECDDPDNATVSVELSGWGQTPPADIYLGYLGEDDPGTGFIKHLLTDNLANAQNATLSDFGNDDDIDLMAIGSNELIFLENDGDQNFESHTISNEMGSGKDVQVADLDGDGDLDLVTTEFSDDRIAWWENDGNNSFQMHVIDDAFDGATSVYVVDIDLDGDIDVLGSYFYSGDDIILFTNNGSGEFTASNVSYDFRCPQSLIALDVDGDGDIDVAAVNGIFRDVGWFENKGDGTFVEILIHNDYYYAQSIHGLDFDHDGDIDFVTGAGADNQDVSWWENDGSENFSKHLITDSWGAGGGGCQGVMGGDFDGDGDEDVSLVDGDGGLTCWLENDGGMNFTEHIIDDEIEFPTNAVIGDIDKDSHPDILATAGHGYDVFWYENDREFGWNFGEVERDSSQTWAFRIYNHGNETLTVEGVSSSNADVFYIDFDEATDVNVGEYIELTVTFTPDDFAEYDDYLEIYSSDPDEETVVVQLNGVGLFVNYPPVLVGELEDIQVNEDFESQVVSYLDEVFSDPNGQELTYEAFSNSEHVTAEVVEGSLVIDSYTDNWFGTVTITVIADDGWGGEEAPGQRDSGPVRQLRHASQLDDNVMSASLLTNTTTSVFGHYGNEDQSGFNRFAENNPGRDDQTEDTFDIEVIPVNDPPEWIDYPASEEVDENQELGFTVEAEDIDEDNLTITSNSDLPEGWELTDNGDGTGEFIWTPTYDDSGEYTLNIVVTDDGEGELQDEETITITVNHINRNPELSYIDDKNVDENQELSFTLEATDPDEDGLTFSVVDLPEGADLTGADFTWTPNYDQSGEYSVTFIVTDDGEGNLTDEETITITVNHINRNPELSYIGDKNIDENQELSFTLEATDPDEDGLTFSVVDLPEGADLTGADFT
ncbi:choice-of-anchor D domain-containing protein, partial [bacterium]|nr:choice-of-anchor D domain-containing protein [bacterium]